MNNPIFDEPGNEPLMLTLCLEEETVLISRAILEILEFPKQIQMMINDETRILLLKACTVEESEAVVIPQQPMLQFEVSGHSLLRRICKLTRWYDLQPRVIYGRYLPKHRAVFFRLDEAQPARLQIPESDLDIRR